MSPIDDAMDQPADFSADRDLWRRCLATETADDEAERFLDLAAFADDRLTDDDERSRVAARLAADPDLAGDVAAARAIAAGEIAATRDGVETIVGRAVAIAETPLGPARVIPLASQRAPQRAAVRAVEGVARWAGLAAAVAFAGWLGFAMGSGASLTLSQPAPVVQTGDGGFLTEIIDPSTGFLRDIGGGRRT